VPVGSRCLRRDSLVELVDSRGMIGKKLREVSTKEPTGSSRSAPGA
jgi:hypothetical protein